MSWARWFTAKEILGEILEADTGLRGEVLSQRCADDSGLRREVQSMLSCHSDFLATPTAEIVPRATLPDAGDRVGGRYRLAECIGRGAYGRVHRALDLRAGGEVAVKLLSLAPGRAAPANLRRELAALRRARLPGIARLLDDGIENDIAFLVMEIVDGEPFPGGEAPLPWGRLAPLAFALLRGLERLHWAGLLHRDLKPANILVGSDDRVTIVDLGVALDQGGGDLPGSRALAGTPTYMAPEVLGGEPASVKSDLYGVGVILWEVLSGRPLHEADNLVELFKQRTGKEATPLADACPDVPAAVAGVVDRLLAIDPSDRPRSARAARRALQGDSRPSPLPRLGGDDIVDRLVDRVRRRESSDVTGPVGAGRTRLLDDAAARLVSEGYRVLRTEPSRAPMGSLVPVIGHAQNAPDVSIRDAEEWAGRRLRRLLESGVVVFVDDEGSLDPLSRRVLGDHRDRGPIVIVVDEARAASTALRPPPLSEEDLRDLFEGPDRIVHLREDAARALYLRTGGRPDRLTEVLDEWEQEGVARRESSRYVVGRPALDRLALSPVLPVDSSLSMPDDLEPETMEVATLLELAGTALPARGVAEALQQPLWAVEAAMEKLVAAGFAAPSESGVRCLVRRELPNRWSDARRRAMHSQIAEALPRGAESRVDHLVAAGRMDEAAAAAVDVARELSGRGESARAHALLCDALAMVRREDLADARTEEIALEMLLDASLEIGTADAIDTLVYHLERSASQTAVVRDVELLARAALATVRGDARRALELTDVSGPLSRPRLDEVRQIVRTLASRAIPPADSRRVLAEALGWARRHPFHGRMAHVSEWLGWHRYRTLEFGRAAALHRRAARIWRAPRSRMSARLNAASAAMEAGLFDEAEAEAREGERIARDCRHTFFEARAYWIQRSVGYRRGDDLVADEEFLRIAARHMPGVPSGLFHMTEAAIAWRSGRLGLAQRLAGRSAEWFETAIKPEPALLMRALEAAAGDAGEAASGHLAALADGALPRLRAQSAALLASAGAPLSEEDRRRNLEYVESVPEEIRDLRCEVLSLSECRGVLMEEER